MSFWDKLFGKSKPAAAPAPASPPELGTMDSGRAIMLDNGRAVRLHADEKVDFPIGTRVSVAKLEVEGTTTWAREVTKSDQPLQVKPMELIPPKTPPPPPPEVIEQRKREYAEGLARRRAAESERRRKWRDERSPGSLDQRRPAFEEKVNATADELPTAALLAAAQPALRAVAIPNQPCAPDGSRLGGEPWLPAAESWPEKDGAPLAFIGQWKLSDVPKGIAKLDLPADGHLLFFYDAAKQPWGFEPADRGGWAVRYVPEGTAAARRSFPEGLTQDARFAECALSFGAAWTLPHPFSARYPEHSDESTDAAWELIETLHQEDLSVPKNQIGGWPELIQSDMEEECHLVSQGVRMGSPADHAATFKPGMEQGAEDWALLFQLDTDEDGPGWMWGDMGMIYFWIRRADLAQRDFSKVWLVLQCT